MKLKQKEVTRRCGYVCFHKTVPPSIEASSIFHVPACEKEWTFNDVFVLYLMPTWLTSLLYFLLYTLHLQRTDSKPSTHGFAEHETDLEIPVKHF